MRDRVPEGIYLRQGDEERPRWDLKGEKEPGKGRPLGRVCYARDTVSAKAPRQEQTGFCSYFLLQGRKSEILTPLSPES